MSIAIIVRLFDEHLLIKLVVSHCAKSDSTEYSIAILQMLCPL
jgi:hypothetical protein